MKKIGAIVCVFLVALAIFGCKAKNKLDEKSVEVPNNMIPKAIFKRLHKVTENR